MKQSEIKGLSTEELVEHIENKTMNLDKMKLSHKVSEIENPLTIRHARRAVARLKTELNNRSSK